MRILVLGAGALGGYFGGRLLEGGGAEVAFLVRPRRAAQLARDGLVIESPFGNLRRPVTTLERAEPGWDVILLTCKAYDLEEAIAAIAPAVDQRTAVLPVLNGLAHIERLQQAFGRERVLGGLARIQAVLAPDGTVRQMNDWRDLVFGELDGAMSPRVLALAEACLPAPGLLPQAVTDIAAQLWHKLVVLGTAAMGTVLLRANVGEIVRAGGAPFLHRILERNAAIAAANGHPVPEPALARQRAIFAEPDSAFTASMLRDLEAGGRIEGEHIIGALLQAARASGIPAEIHEAAALSTRAYEQRRAAGRLPPPVAA
jgi:2-dehydropantoate 2-reductase